MVRGIIIMGLNGCGKTTVGRMLAEELGYFRMDAEDYYFLKPGDYSLSRPQEEVHRLMEMDAYEHGHFVLSCVRCNVTDTLVSLVDLAVVLRTAPETRAARIVEREERRFGSRVLPGGDMYQSQQDFHAFAARRTEAYVDVSLCRLSCPIIEIDTLLAPQEIVKRIIQVYNKLEASQTR